MRKLGVIQAGFGLVTLFILLTGCRVTQSSLIPSGPMPHPSYGSPGATDQPTLGFADWNELNLVLQPGETKQLQPESNVGPVTWQSSDESVATVDAAGKLTAKQPGPVTVTASAGGYAAKALFAVAPTPALAIPIIEPQGYVLHQPRFSGPGWLIIDNEDVWRSAWRTGLKPIEGVATQGAVPEPPPIDFTKYTVLVVRDGSYFAERTWTLTHVDELGVAHLVIPRVVQGVGYPSTDGTGVTSVWLQIPKQPLPTAAMIHALRSESENEELQSMHRPPATGPTVAPSPDLPRMSPPCTPPPIGQEGPCPSPG